MIKAIVEPWFNLNGVQATTHMDSPLVIVNGPIAREIGMNGGVNPFGSGNRANAAIGHALRLIMFDVGGGWARDPNKYTLGNLAKYSYCIAENGAESPFAPYHVEQGYGGDPTVVTIAAEAPHSVTDHQCNDSEGVLGTICSMISTIT